MEGSIPERGTLHKKKYHISLVEKYIIRSRGAENQRRIGI